MNDNENYPFFLTLHRLFDIKLINSLLSNWLISKNKEIINRYIHLHVTYEENTKYGLSLLKIDKEF